MSSCFGSISSLLNSAFDKFKVTLEELLSKGGKEADVLLFADCLFLRGSIQFDLPAFLLGRPFEDVMSDVAAYRHKVRLNADFWRSIVAMMKANSSSEFLMPMAPKRYPPFWVFCRFCSLRLCSVYDIFALVETKTTRQFPLRSILIFFLT